MKLCYVFDIDGTLADCSHRLHFIERDPNWPAFFAAVDEDEPILHMIRLAVTIFDADMPVVFASGRSDECREKTEAWLTERIGIEPYGENSRLYMRRAGDHRDDSVVKIELLAQMRADGFEPIMVFEDRARVVQAWRAAGIPCAQVADGNF